MIRLLKATLALLTVLLLSSCAGWTGPNSVGLPGTKGDDKGLPTPDQLAAYTAWADGLADRTGRVTAPNLVTPAVGVATAANDFVGKLKEISATPHAPGAPTPPAVYQLSILNDQITADIGELTKACKR